MDNNFNNISLIQMIIKWKWHILAITVAAAVCGAIFSSDAFITPLFKSEAVAYPANISPYSDESETEQMLQIVNSQSIMDSIVEKYNLWNHYKINKEDPFAKTYMVGEYRDKIKITKTPYEAISIIVSDKDPVMASNIAKSILNFYDQKIGALHKQKAGEVVAMYERQLRTKQHDIDSLKNRMAQLSENHGVLEYTSQTREVMRSYLGGASKANELKNSMEKYGPEVLELQTKIAAEANAYVTTKVEYEQGLRFYNAEMTYSNIVTEPFPADKKSFPVRWVIVALCGLGAFTLSILTLFVIENKKVFASSQK
jgi:Chain length determinant protein.